MTEKITLKDFINTFQLNPECSLGYPLEETLNLKHEFLMYSIGVLPGDDVLLRVTSRSFLKTYFKTLSTEPTTTRKTKPKKIIMLYPLEKSLDEVEFNYTFSSISSFLKISKKDLNRFLKDSGILQNGKPTPLFPPLYYRKDVKSFLLNLDGFTWIKDNYLNNN